MAEIRRRLIPVLILTEDFEQAVVTVPDRALPRVARWEDLPAEVRLALTPTASPESSVSSSASLFPDEGLPPHEKRILGLLKADESTHIDEIVEQLETELSSSEIFVALLELELAGKVRQMPGKNFVKSF